MFIFTCFLSFFTYLVLLFLSIVILCLYSLIRFIPPVCYVVVEFVSLWKVFLRFVSLFYVGCLLCFVFSFTFLVSFLWFGLVPLLCFPADKRAKKVNQRTARKTVSSSHHEMQIRRKLALPMQFGTTATQLCHHVISPKTISAALLYLTCLLPSSCCPSVGEIYFIFL